MALRSVPAPVMRSMRYLPHKRWNSSLTEAVWGSLSWLLQDCKWIDKHKNLLITGSSGAGKTYIACALCVTALHQLRSVKYIRAMTLLNESAMAQKEQRALEFVNEMASYDLLVIDDFGLMDLDIEKCSDIFEIVETRDTRKSTIVASLHIPLQRSADSATNGMTIPD